MTPLNSCRISSVPALNNYLRSGPGGFPASKDRPALELLGDGPTADEWRRAFAVIAEQIVLHLAGYVGQKEFAKDGCRFVWDRFRSIATETTDGGS